MRDPLEPDQAAPDEPRDSGKIELRFERDEPRAREPRGPLVLLVGGMTCAACVRHVEEALTRVPGVADASVSLLARTALIESSPAQEGELDELALVRAVEGAGYTAELPASQGLGALEEAERRAESERPHGLARAALSLGAMLVVMALLAGVDASSHADPVGHALMRAMGPIPALSARLAGWLGRPLVVGLAFALTAATVAGAGGRIVRSGLRSLVRLRGDMNALVSLGVLAALVGSVPAALTGGALYLEGALGILGMVLLGQALEGRAQHATKGALRALARTEVELAHREQGGVEADVPVAELRRGDLVVVRPGERVPADAELVEGEAEVDESLVTGEPMPVHKRVGARVAAGTRAMAGTFRARVSAVGRSSSLAKLGELLSRASSGRGETQRLADRAASWLVPVVVTLSLGTFVAHLALGERASLAFELALTVMVVACPCALGLATPTAAMVATGRALGDGVLLSGASTLERAARVDTVVLDKTGTLTLGRPRVLSVLTAEGGAHGRDDVLLAAASVEHDSEHPLARAIVGEARARGLSLGRAKRVTIAPGRGVSGHVRGAEVRVGRPDYVCPDERHAEARDALAEAAEASAPAGATFVLVSRDGAPMGAITLGDELRPEAREAVRALFASGLRVLMLSGDAEPSARAIAAEVGIDEVHAGASPEGKLALVLALRREGRHVAMVGDGINDAAAVAAAELGVSLGSGTELARHAAHATLVGDDLRRLPRLLSLGKRTVRVMRRNLGWALVYNALALPLAAGLFRGLGVALTPMMASALMALSSVSVVTSSLSLGRRSSREGSSGEGRKS